MGTIDLMITSGCATSRGESRRAIQEGGVYLNNIRITDVNQMITLQNAVVGQYYFLRRGSKNNFIVKLVD